MTIDHNGERRVIDWMGMATILPRELARGYEDSEWRGLVVRHLGSLIFNPATIALDLLASLAHMISALALSLISGIQWREDPEKARETAAFAFQHIRFASLCLPLIPVHLFSAIYPPIFSQFEESDTIETYLKPEFAY